MNVALELLADDGTIATLGAPLALEPGRYAFRYPTRTGALVTIDGDVRGAFDREHREIEIDLAAGARSVELRVERRSLPVAGLPSGDGVRWRGMLARAAQTPARKLGIGPAIRPVCGLGRSFAAESRERSQLELIGHAHLDVAWLWSYSEARRKAARTFATALRQMTMDPSYVFTQSQPQLYAWVEADEPQLFAGIAEAARGGRFDPSGAALWVESDCNLPSGESLLRQLVHGKRYVMERFGIEPHVAWLPDTFGFCATLPQLLRHAGVDGFATTKLRWNDTTVFPHERFWWRAPDGSRVLGALFASYEGDFDERREKLARARREPLILGYGDGGGGATDPMVRRSRFVGTWTTLAQWFARAREAASAAPIPEHRDELYLEYHRGVLTTHRDLKARNAALERRLREVEELGAWTRALHASPFFLDEFRKQIREAWELVLRAQFHDAITGTCVADAAAEIHADYDRAEALLEDVAANAQSVLPRRPASNGAARDLAPRADGAARRARGATYRFENEYLTARVGSDGLLTQLCAPADRARAGGMRANVLRAYRDRPAKWDAWNVDRGYERKPVRVRFDDAGLDGDALEIHFRVGRSLGVMRVALREHEPFLRVELALDWREAHVLLRMENEAYLGDARARFGVAHGTHERSLYDRSRAALAKFEVPGQRYLRIDGTDALGARSGVALLSLDGYGWNARALKPRRVAFGHSLIRGPRWPDPACDIGQHTFSLAFAPLAAGTGNGVVEALWQRFAGTPEVAMFASDDAALAIVATKLADDGDGVIVRARECDGAARDVEIRCAARAVSVTECDALERALPESDAELTGARPGLELREGSIFTRFAPYQLRTFRVRLA